ncbi:MAG: MFS transporter [Coriobacteriales bacterium]|jgi:MFS family permease|nr:MFS transporter [Coriobacteriales bacterium]
MVARIKQADWSSFVFVFLAGVFLGVSFFKVPPTIPLLMGYFQTDVGTAGWMMSVCSIAGTLVAIPAGAIQSRLGPKNTLLAALGWTILSIIIGVFSPTIEVFMVSQFIGGLGNGFIAVAAPTLITVMFKNPAKRGLPNSIWACWTAAGSLIMFNAASIIATSFGTWQSVWWASLIAVVIITVLAAVGIRVDKAEAQAVAAGSAQIKLSQGFTSPYGIILMVLFFCFAFGYSVWAALAPTFMQMVAGMDMPTANALASITTITGIIGSLTIGVILNRVKNQPLVLVVCFILAGITMCLELLFTTVPLMIMMAILCGLLLNICPPALFSNVPHASPDPSVMGAIFGLLAVGANLGGIPAANTVGAIVDATQGNWAMGTIPLAIVAALGIILSIIFYKGTVNKALAVKTDNQNETRGT